MTMTEPERVTVEINEADLVALMAAVLLGANWIADAINRDESGGLDTDEVVLMAEGLLDRARAT
jgi:hypothetical protein